MHYKGKAEQVATQIVEAFEAGRIPEALATVFIHREKTDSPCHKWSWSNRLLAALHGHHDGRGFRQWKQVGRSVKRGEKAFGILAPWIIKAKEDDEERNIKKGDPLTIGFLRVPVFGYIQTEGDPLPGYEEEAAFLDALPLIEVARAWEIDVTTFHGPGADQRGFYRHRTELRTAGTAQPTRQVIGLGVENVSTWTHELVHAADNRRGTLTRAHGQQLDNEIVATLGGAVLLECLGHHGEADRGGAWEYISAYAKEHKRQPVAVCTDLLDRVAACVALILETAEELAGEGEESREARAAG